MEVPLPDVQLRGRPLEPLYTTGQGRLGQLQRPVSSPCWPARRHVAASLGTRADGLVSTSSAVGNMRSTASRPAGASPAGGRQDLRSAVYAQPRRSQMRYSSDDGGGATHNSRSPGHRAQTSESCWKTAMRHARRSTLSRNFSGSRDVSLRITWTTASAAYLVRGNSSRPAARMCWMPRDVAIFSLTCLETSGTPVLSQF